MTATNPKPQPGRAHAQPPARGICRVLVEDSELAEAVPAAERDRASEECLATTLTVEPGIWSGRSDGPMLGGIGLLVLRGLLIRRVGISGDHGAELLGEGDLLRPWEGGEDQPAFSHTTAWRVLEPAQLAGWTGTRRAASPATRSSPVAWSRARSSGRGGWR